jgi:hypothetical protein
MQSTQTGARRALARATSPELVASIQPAKEAAAGLKRRAARFESYGFLEAIYRIYIDWKCRKIAKRSARALANELNIVWRKSMSPIRVLIEAVLPDADFKQKSRWVRALEYLAEAEIPAKQFQRFVRVHGGLAGCARLAAKHNRKRQRSRLNWDEGDWN